MNQAISSSSIPYSPRRRSSHHHDDDQREEQQQLLGDHADDESRDGGDGYDKELFGTHHVSRGLERFVREKIMNGTRTVLFVALVGCVVLFAVMAFPGRHLAFNTDFARDPSDYILDSDWDFDAAPTSREYRWEIVDVVANPDGVYRPMITIDGKFPGPMVEANQGDTVRFHVVNRAKNSTSIHFHGIFQNGSNWMDGAPGVTQCPIPPGHSFTYEFVLNQSGTYMYHAHQGAQALDGLFGPFIVHSPLEKTREYGTDRVILVQDWYHDLSAGLMFKRLSPGSKTSPAPDSVLINGRNVVRCKDFPGRHCDTSVSYVPAIELPPGTPHRLRIINTGGFAWFDVSIGGHENLLDLVEVDGVSIQPAPEQKVVLGPGQRYSVVVRQPPGTDIGDYIFWFRVRMIKECFAAPVVGPGEATAILSYRDPEKDVARLARMGRRTRSWDLSKQARTERATECRDMKSIAYSPVQVIDAPEVADHSWNIRVSMEIGDWGLERGYLNGSSFRPQIGAPTLHRVVDGLRSGNEFFSMTGVNTQAFHLPNELVISQDSIEVVDIVLQNLDEGNHPFHLHGYQMFVLAQGHGHFPGYESLGLAAEGKGLLGGTDAETSILRNPLRRDTATVEGLGWLLVRFVADNPGIWYFHCHIAWHEGGGMGMQFASRLGVMREWTIPKENLDLCSADISELAKGMPPEDGFWEGSWFGEDEVDGNVAKDI